MSERRFKPHSKPADNSAAAGEAEVDEDLILPLARHRRLRPLLLLLLNDRSERISSEQAAEIVNVETKYFSRFFSRETGFKFSWWNREMRVRPATRLLHRPDLNIDSVGSAVGYTDATTFARAFKKSTGVCPRAYRRSCRISRASPQEQPPDPHGTEGDMTKDADKQATNIDRSREDDADAT